MHDPFGGRQRVLDFITEYLERERWSPSLAEIAAGVGLKSRTNIHRYLADLERAGLIERKPPPHPPLIRLPADAIQNVSGKEEGL